MRPRGAIAAQRISGPVRSAGEASVIVGSVSRQVDQDILARSGARCGAQLGGAACRLLRSALEGAAIAGAAHGLDEHLRRVGGRAQAAQRVVHQAEGHLALAHDGQAHALPSSSATSLSLLARTAVSMSGLQLPGQLDDPRRLVALGRGDTISLGGPTRAAPARRGSWRRRRRPARPGAQLLDPPAVLLDHHDRQVLVLQAPTTTGRRGRNRR